MIMTIKSLVYQEMNESHGNWSTDRYKDIILNIILAIYLSEKFDTIYQELLDEGDGFEEYEYLYEAADTFFIPPESRWNNIVKNIEIKDNAVIFDNALNYLKHANPILKEIILPFSIFRIGKSALDKSALKTFIYLFNDQLNKNKHVQKEKWIELYKSFLEDFARFDEKYDCYLKKFIDEYYPVLHRDTLST